MDISQYITNGISVDKKGHPLVYNSIQSWLGTYGCSLGLTTCGDDDSLRYMKDGVCVVFIERVPRLGIGRTSRLVLDPAFMTEHSQVLLPRLIGWMKYRVTVPLVTLMASELIPEAKQYLEWLFSRASESNIRK